MEALLRLIERVRGDALFEAIRLAPEGATPDQIRRLQDGLLHPPRDPERRGQRKHERLPWPRTAEDGTPLGLDLKAHSEEIRRVISTIPYRRGANADFAAAVWVALADKNHLESAYDPRRGWSVSGYIAKVAYAVRGKLRREARRDGKRQRLESPYQEEGT